MNEPHYNYSKNDARESKQFKETPEEPSYDHSQAVFKNANEIPVKSRFDDLVESKEDVEQVVHPTRYRHFSLETIDLMKAGSSKEEFMGYLKLNIFKYIERYPWKAGSEDLKKAKFYLQRLIEEQEDTEQESK